MAKTLYYNAVTEEMEFVNSPSPLRENLGERFGLNEGGRIGFSQGTSMQILEYLESLDLAEGVTADIDDVMQYAKENNIKIDQGSVSRNLNNPNRLQTSGRYKGNYQLSDDIRARWNAVKDKVKVRKQLYSKKTQAKIFNQLDEIIPDKKTYPTRRSLMTKLGFSEESGSASINKMLKDYAKARNIDLTGRFPVGQYQGTQVAIDLISDYKKGEVTIADLARKYFPNKKLRDARIQVNSILRDAGVRDPSKFRNWPGDKPEQWKKVRAQRVKELVKRVGVDTAAQTLSLEKQILAKNADILKMTDNGIWNNKKIKKAMNLDVKDLKKNGTLKFDRYKNLSKKEFVAKVRQLANTGQFWQPEHMAGIATEKLHAMFPKEVQAASGKIGSQMDAMRAYLKANPNGKAVPEIEKLLNEFNMQIKSGGKTYGFKEKIIFNSKTGTSNIVEAGTKIFDKGTLLGTTKEVGKKLLKGVEKIVSPLLTPAASIAAHPHIPTSGLEWVTPAFWNTIAKKYGLEGTMKTLLKAPNAQAKTRIVLNMLLRAGIPMAALPAISTISTAVAGPLLISEGTQWLHKKLEEADLSGEGGMFDLPAVVDPKRSIGEKSTYEQIKQHDRHKLLSEGGLTGVDRYTQLTK